ncbi:MAG TPA: triose-phosphate isomerase [Synergistales bacterium]|nr:triose-phosphate isomerase [Synergistales bacterium]
MERTPLIAGNWKMHHGISATGKFLSDLEARISRDAGAKKALEGAFVEMAIFPPFTSLWRALEGKRYLPWLKVGAQNVHWASEGAFTGEISADMLKEAGCDYVIIGHSERRQFFGETDEQVRRKIDAAVSAGLRAVLCVGETLQERETGETMAVVEKQLMKALVGLPPDEVGRSVCIAYEPVWAIGTGRNATPGEAQEVCQAIRRFVAERFGDEAGMALRVLYGGSVKTENAAGLLSEPDIDGALVGGASLQADSFAQILIAAL